MPIPVGHGSVTVMTRGGHLVQVRHIGPADGHLLLDLFNSLSPESRQKRFFVSKADLPEGLIPPDIERFVHLSQVDEVALVATVAADAGEQAVGLAQLVFSADDPTSAEVAMVIHDGYQGAGLGRALFDLLLQAAIVREVRQVIAIMQAENTAMYRLMERSGFPISSTTHNGETTTIITVA